MKITKRLTPYNFTSKNDTKRIKYIVIHYFGSLATAKNVADYWAGKYVGASAHYTVGHAGEVYQCVGDEDIAWHCGAKSYKHPACRNSNSIGIEMAVRKKITTTMSASDKDWYFEDATVAAAAALTKELMEKYKVPEENVIRHYDVTGKTCPNPYVFNNTKDTWTAFKKALKEAAAPTVPPAVPAPTPPPQPQPAPPQPAASILYRIRRSWLSPNSQIYALKDIENAKKNCPAGYKVFDESGKVVYDPAATELPYEVVSMVECLNIRCAASGYSMLTGKIKDKNRYTIVEESGAWGRLKSGKGWISLKYTKRAS